MAGTTWSKFYWSDWLSDPAVRACSPAARGLWIDMLCVAAGHDPIGYVAVNGRSLSAEEIARIAGLAAPEVETLLRELERNGVFSRDRKGVIFSRRMVRDQKRVQSARKNGKEGGNPLLKKEAHEKQKKPGKSVHFGDCSDADNSTAYDIPVKGVDKGRDNTHKPEANSHKPEEQQLLRPPDLSRRSREDFSALEAALREASGLERDRTASAKLADVSPIIGLIDAGVSLEKLILPVLRSKRGRCSRVGSWEWFVPAIRDAYEKQQNTRSGALMKAVSSPKPTDPNDPDVSLVDIRGRETGVMWKRSKLVSQVVEWQKSGKWSMYGARPDHPDCPIPRALLDDLGVKIIRAAEAAQ
jgi:DNA-binding Lrp family transcriptional regulator